MHPGKFAKGEKIKDAIRRFGTDETIARTEQNAKNRQKTYDIRIGALPTRNETEQTFQMARKQGFAKPAIRYGPCNGYR